MDINLKTLIGKLNDTSRVAATRAAGICVGLGQYEVDIEHLFLALLEQPGCDLVAAARPAGVSLTGLESDLRREVERLPGGSTRTPVFSRHLPLLFEHAWLIASLGGGGGTGGGQQRIRSGHLLLALLTEPGLAQLAQRASPQFAGFPLDRLKHDFDKLTRGSEEAQVAAPAPDTASGDPVGELAATAPGKTPALDQYTTCLTARAREGKVDPVIGRDAEIRQVIDILMRRRQNNPILTGEAGVGKTAVVEGLALRIALGDVPEVFHGVEIHTLDMGLLQAGASVKGEFENRLKNVIDEVKKSLHPIILFIDEAHTMIGAGGTAGQNDAANLLKPALARGELRTVAATTWGEYKKYFEKDAALARRFQVVKVEEPDEDTASAMLRAMAPLMERHFGVRIYDEAITEAVRLSHRYISGRQLPDKAISVLDTACAKVALGQNTTPAALEECARRLERLDARIGALVREESAGADHGKALDALRTERADTLQEQARLRERWEREQALSGEIHALRARLESAVADNAVNAGAADLKAKVEALRQLQGEAPLVPVQVDGHTVAAIVAGWTGIPLGRMVKDEIRTVMNLRGLLDERILGQGHASAIVAQRVRTARAQLEDPNKPKGVFLFVGTSGVGKTEAALALADLLYGGERKLITINMSEYQEAHSVSGLKGSPPGYVGYGEGGVLTEAVRRNPYSVVLLDEVEKAHGDVLELFFQVFDKGVLDDAEGRQIDFRNTIIILTSNAASSQIMQACLNKPAEERPTPEQLAELIRPSLVKHFKPAFLGRLSVVPFYPIDDAVLANIIRLKLERIKARVAANHHAQFHYDDALVAAVLARCTEVDSGARKVDAILNDTLLPEIADSVLATMAEGGAIARVKVSATRAGKIKYAIETV
jgi:type VI secretion system protein VasG